MSDKNPYEGKGVAGEGDPVSRPEDDAVVQLSREFAQASVEYDANYGRTAAEAAIEENERNQAAFDAAKAVETPTGADYFPETTGEPAVTLSSAFEQYGDGSETTESTESPSDQVTDGSVTDADGTSAADATVATDAEKEAAEAELKAREANGTGTDPTTDAVVDYSGGTTGSDAVEALEAQTAEDAGEPEPTKYDDLNKDELAEKAGERGLHVSGNKDELKGRLVAYDTYDDSGLKEDIVKVADGREVDSSGTKAEIIARLVDADEKAAAEQA